MSIHEHSTPRKGKLFITCGHPPEHSAPDQSFDPNVSQVTAPVFRPVYRPPNGRTFEEMRRMVACRTWRLSPNVPGLAIVKRMIVSAYAWGAIRTTTAQRLIDRTKSWEA